MDDSFKIVFLFSGQGSQYRNMGQQLFKQNNVFRNSLEQSNQVVQKHLNKSLIDELYNTQDSVFNDLLITHPAIVAVEIAMFHTLEEMNIKPDYVIGNSLGEFSAAVASGIWSAEVAIEAAIEQAKSIVTNTDEGGMLSVLTQRTKAMETLYGKYNIFLAADNFNRHFTLSGLTDDLDAFQKELHAAGIDFFRLPVSFPFHSPLINEAKNRFINFMKNVELTNTKTEFITGIQYDALSEVSGNYFWDVVSNYYNFSETINCMEQKHPCFYIDLGPSGSSATFVKYNLSPYSISQTFSIMTLFQKEMEQLKSLKNILV